MAFWAYSTMTSRDGFSTAAEGADAPLFSLLVCTIGRVAELERLLISLRAQECQDFELVIVDQNTDGRLDDLLERYASSMDIVRVMSERGLSKARNIGLQRCAGRYVAMPDDDCWYSPAVLRVVAAAFERNPDIGVVTGTWCDESGKPGFGNSAPQRGVVSAHYIWTRAISFTIFMRRDAMLRTGGFDERLGVGAGTPWSAAEETDYLLRALSVGIVGWQEPECIVMHPKSCWSDPGASQRAASYGRGIGFVLRKHRAGARMVCRFLLRPLGGMVIAFITGQWRRVEVHRAALHGRLTGWIFGR